MQDPRQKKPAADAPAPAVKRYAGCDRQALRSLLAGYGLALEEVRPAKPIPGSYWGDEEAGLVGSRLLARPDTPVHSILHEACHFICMDEARRTGLDTDAGGSYDEENAVCYLQVLLAEHLPDMGRHRMLADMDRWGYSFRLGSARRWFEEDSADALAWLQRHRIVDPAGSPTWKARRNCGAEAAPNLP